MSDDIGAPLVPPSDPDDEYVPPREVLAFLPDPRTGNPPGEQNNVDIPGPVMRAAKIKDIPVVRDLLRHGFQPTNYIVDPETCPWKSSVTNALYAVLDLNSHLKLLVESRGNPDGFLYFCFRVASTRFLRGRALQDTWTNGCYLRDRAEAMADVSPIQVHVDQAAVILEAELEHRRKFRCRFWAEPPFPRSDFPTNNPPHALSAAIETGNTAIDEYLVRHGSDESAWIDARKYDPLTDDLQASYFVVESPMLAGIKRENKSAVQFLLGRGHKPDIFPMVRVTRCMNPIIATLAKHNPWLEGFDLLAPYADFSLLTPIFQCHLLHFAVAILDLPLIQHVINTMGGLIAAQAVPPTALGHTLLHVASLPINGSVVNMHSQKIYASAHEFRTTDEQWMPQSLISTPPLTLVEMRGRGRGRRNRVLTGRRNGTMFFRTRHISPRVSDLSQSEAKVQSTVLLYLLRSGSVPRGQLERQDVHGNTVLHYLVFVRNPDNGLIKALREFVPSEEDDIWAGIGNVYGYTAGDLDADGRAARTARAKYRESDHMSFWNDNANDN